ncbi:hypothetical protein Q9290_09985 [Oceanimonas sp. CHS3-5]|uniref:hypothetical protein n=1 Tax=Oceanimonas sp. CHS3-5 TaxID=3068186 RepID=UPI00273E2557|nr:hypothetical protein [Oceanimonas sp. CHS3-5]MDP5292613.1 hypothetical protein [Oceanimonas sp. CHS3-5]
MDQIFNNREVAVSIWAGLLFIFGISKAGVRDAAKNVVIAFFHPKIVSTFLFMGIYTWGVVKLLQIIDLWNFVQLKNTIFWFIFVGVAEIFKATSAQGKEHYFKNSLKSHFKILVILEFVVAFQSFSLIAEIFIVPISAFLGALLAVSQSKEEFEPVEKIISWLLSIFGIIFILYGCYYMSTHLDKFLQIKTILDFLTPILLSIFLLPFVYVLSVYILYERILIRINIYTSNKKNRLFGKVMALIHFNRDHKSLEKWLAYSCMDDFRTKKSIEESIKSFNQLDEKMV